MSQELKDKLNITGLRHIIAVSGTHIVILSYILMSLLLLLGFWRGQAFYLSIALIWSYIVLTGLPASGIRAGIMGSIFMLGQKLGRQNSGQRTIALAAAAMLFLNPLLLLYDVGFQLSFLAALGIIYLDPLLKSFFKKLTNYFKNSTLLNMLSATLAAQIFTLPVMAYSFGNVSLIAPLTNLLILPVVEPLMIFGFLSVIFGTILPVFGWLLSFPCQVLLSYFIKIIDLFSLPFAIKVFENVSWIWLAVSYILLALLIRFFNSRQRIKFLV